MEKEAGIFVAAIPCNEGRLAHSWVNVRGGMRVFLSVRLAFGGLDPEE